jgi:hypothetical protein
MSYEEFSIERVQNVFSIAIEDVPNLFGAIPPAPPSARLLSLLEDFIPLGSSIGTEKARSEFIIAPIMAEVKTLTGNKVSLFSGNRFDVDKDKGLTGYCDFMFSLSSSQLVLSAPVVAVVEAKNDNINSGFGQCMAEMVAARIYNLDRKNPVHTVYGCVTTGSVWRYLRLTEAGIALDSAEYYLDQLPKILGIFLASVGRQD